MRRVHAGTRWGLLVGITGLWSCARGDGDMDPVDGAAPPGDALADVPAERDGFVLPPEDTDPPADTSAGPDSAPAPDTEVPVDTAPPEDTASPPPDTATPPPDTSVPEPDAPPPDVTCASPMLACDLRCVDPQTDERHCGRCGNTCTSVQRCTAGRCACPAGQTACGTSCVDTASDPMHCGRCGNACPAGSTCVSGACGGTCMAPRTMCTSGGASLCVDTATDLRHCGRCGNVCSGTGAMAACMGGMCTMAGCRAGFSDCNGGSDGCEVNHNPTGLTCGGGLDLGAFCGDNACGTFCGSTSYRVVNSRTGRAATWLCARITECSNCPSRISHRISLTVPAGVDYDLFVYGPCGTVLGSSRALAGMPDQVEFFIPDTLISNDSRDYFIEVRYYSGASCNNWTLTLEARAASGTSC